MQKFSGVDVQAFLQARMSSQRLPGKVLMPLAGKPLFEHVFERVSQVLEHDRIMIVTSSHASDDEFCGELEKRSIRYFRGELDDVLGRFSAAWDHSPSEWVMRLSCDSPLLSPEVIRLVLGAVDAQFDIVTNVFPRTFPKGQSVEVLNYSLFSKLKNVPLPSHSEHVTQYLYENPGNFRIRNVLNPEGDQSHQSDVVDTPEDLKNMKHRMEG
jgi:spore coat polysaccharide biosynthesis protein SpsF